MKLTKRLLAMALAGVMLLTILTGCGGKSGDRLVEEYMATILSEHSVPSNIPITHDVPEIKTVAEKFDASWLNPTGGWTFSSSPADPTYTTLQNIFSNYKSGYAVFLYACEVDSKQSEFNQTMRVMSAAGYGLLVHNNTTSSSPMTAVKCATRLVTRGNKSYRIVVIIYDHTAG